MNRLTRLLLFVPLILTVLLAPYLAITAQHSGAMMSMAVQIPMELKLAINAVLLFLVTYGLQWVFDQIGLDLRGVGTTLAIAVSEFLILQFQGLINLVPVQYDLLVMIGLNVLLAILTGLGFFQVVFQRDRAAALFK